MKELKTPSLKKNILKRSPHSAWQFAEVVLILTEKEINVKYPGQPHAVVYVAVNWDSKQELSRHNVLLKARKDGKLF
jgi:hypothetical protein